MHLSKTKMLCVFVVGLFFGTGIVPSIYAKESSGINSELMGSDAIMTISKSTSDKLEPTIENDFVFGFIFSIVTYYQEYEDYYRAEVNGFYIIWYHEVEEPGIDFLAFINEPWSDKNLDFWFGIANQFLITGFFCQKYS